MNGSTEIRAPVDIHELVRGRGAAIDHWMQAFDAFHEHTAAAARDCLGAAGLALNIPRGNSYDDGALAQAFVGKDRDAYLATITQVIDRLCWRHMLDRLGFDALLDRQAREEFAASVAETPPVFNVENATATFGEIWENRRAYLLRGIANTFMALDRRFRSHDGFKIGARLIIDHAINEWGSWSRYDRRDTLHDVEKAFCDLEQRPVPNQATGIVAEVQRAASDARQSGDWPQVAKGRYFRVRVFKNGNLHLWFERDDLLREVNLLLAEHYGEVIGDGHNETKADAVPQYHITPAKGWGAFMSSAAVAGRVIDMANCHRQRVLEPSAGTGMLARAARDRECEVVCVEIQRGLAHELAEDGFKVRCADFLSCTVAELGLFDLVIMNPPFDRGRDCDHVRHAWQFVKPGGRLVAVMSARAEFGTDKRHAALHRLISKAKIAGYRRTAWHDLPAGSFAHAGTNVNTVILAIDKPA